MGIYRSCRCRWSGALVPAAWAQTWEDSGVLNLHRLQLAGVQAEQPQDGGGDLGGLDRSADAEAMAAYRGLLAEPALRRLAIADACARLPQGMVSITVLLVAAEHASMAVAGLAVAGYTLGQALTGPARGRLAPCFTDLPLASSGGEPRMYLQARCQYRCGSYRE